MLALYVKFPTLLAVFKFVDGGGWRRPVWSGVALAILFSLCTLVESGFAGIAFLVEFVLALLLCPFMLLLYWRQEGVVFALGIASVAVFILLVGLPILVGILEALLYDTFSY